MGSNLIYGASVQLCRFTSFWSWFWSTDTTTRTLALGLGCMDILSPELQGLPFVICYE
uniref:Uncharacterized protein n=1 Tax=Rhizophora mucronata TaxID=61149 RepID=A0A2P2NAT3_RHIMU